MTQSKFYDNQDDFNFELVNFQFLDGEIPRSPFYSVYILVHVAYSFCESMF